MTRRMLQPTKRALRERIALLESELATHACELPWGLLATMLVTGLFGGVGLAVLARGLFA